MRGTLLVVAALVAVAAALYESSDNVVALTKANFETDVLADEHVWLVTYYVESEECEGCHKLVPLYEEVATKLDGLVRVGAVNCETEKDTCQRAGLKNIPALQLYPMEVKRNPYQGNRAYKNPQNYDGSVSLDTLTNWALAGLPSNLVTSVTDDSFAKFMAGELPKTLLFTSKAKATALYKALSVDFKDRMSFGLVVAGDNPKLVADFSVESPPRLVVLPAGVSDPAAAHVFEGTLSHAELSEFIAPHAAEKKAAAPPPPPKEKKEKKEKAPKEPPPPPPPTGPKKHAVALTDKNFQEKVVDSILPWLVEFYSNKSGEYVEGGEEWEKVASELAHVAGVGAVDADAHPELVKKYNVKKIPSIKVFPHEMKRTPVTYAEKSRTKEALVSYAHALLPSYVITLDVKNFDQFISFEVSKSYKVILFTKNDKTWPVMKSLSAIYRDLMIGEIHHTDKLLVEKFNITTFPNLFIIGPHPSDPRQQASMQYNGMYDPTSLAQLMGQLDGQQRAANKKPGSKSKDSKKDSKEGEVLYVGNNEAWEEQCINSGSTCFVAVFNHEDLPDGEDTKSAEAVKYFKMLKTLAGKHTSQPIKFVWTTSAHPDLLTEFHLDTGFPAAVVMSAKRNRYAVYRGAFAQAPMSDFVNGIFKATEKLYPYKRHPKLLEEEPAWVALPEGEGGSSESSGESHEDVEEEEPEESAEAAEEREAKLAAAMAALNKARGERN